MIFLAFRPDHTLLNGSHYIHYTSSLRKMSANDAGFIAALEEAKKSFAEGGVPIGACLVAADGKILGRGHNMRVQKSSAILHVR